MRERVPQANQKTADWKDFLRVIAPQYVNQNTEVTISEKEETVSFTIETAEIPACQEHFARVLRNSDSLNAQLSYFSQSSGSAPDSSVASSLEMPIIATIEDARALMKKLFGDAVMQGENLTNINFNTRFTRYEQGVLLSEPRALSTHLGKMMSLDAPLSQNFLCAYFHHVSVEDLRAIIAEESAPLPQPSEAILEESRGEGFVQTCFGIFEAEGDDGKRYIQMYFDIGRFLQFVYPPQLHCEAQNETRTCVRLSLSHLLLYVKQLSRHGLLFSVELQHGRVNAHPLLLPHRETIVRPLNIFIVLDDSGSMRDCRRDVFKSVKSFIEKVAVIAPEAKIHLSIFSTKNDLSLQTNLAKDFDFSIFNKPFVDRQTALYDALTTPLSDMKRQLNSHNNMLLILTDGADNCSATTQTGILKTIKDLKQAVLEDGAAPPAIYAVGYGEVDEKVLTALAESAGHQEYIAPQNVAEFSTIVQNIEGFEHRRILAQFITEINGKKERHIIPIPLHGNPHVVREVTFPLSADPVKVTFSTPTQGQELALQQITLQITRTQAQETMEQYRQRIEAIYLNPDLKPVVKIAQLNALGGEIDTFCTNAPQAAVLALAADAHQKIAAYKEALLTQHDAAIGSEKEASVSAASVVPAIAALGNPAYSSPASLPKAPTEPEERAAFNP